VWNTLSNRSTHQVTDYLRDIDIATCDDPLMDPASERLGGEHMLLSASAAVGA